MDRNDSHKKIAVLGGTFDPVHTGHLFLLNYAVEQTDYNCFFIIPAKQSNFKRDNIPQATDLQRIEMLNLAMEDYTDMFGKTEKTLIVSDLEIRRGGISYTSDTVAQIIKEYKPEGKIGLIIGDDHLPSLGKWHDYDFLKNNAQFIICRRLSATASASSLPDPKPSHIFLDIPQTREESSTAVRANLREHSSYLPPRVLAYIKANNLYNL